MHGDGLSVLRTRAADVNKSGVHYLPRRRETLVTAKAATTAPQLLSALKGEVRGLILYKVATLRSRPMPCASGHASSAARRRGRVNHGTFDARDDPCASAVHGVFPGFGPAGALQGAA